MTKTKQEILRLINEANVRYIRLCFTDILGQIKGMSIPRTQIEQVLEEGQPFDGSSVEGFARIEESDLMAMPDPVTFRILPWPIAGEKVAIMFCDIVKPDGTPYDGDPRWVLRRQLQKAAQHGWTYYIGPELEYFYFENEKAATAIDADGYFDMGTVDRGSLVRKATVSALEQMEIPVEAAHHEVAPSQHEIDLKYQEALVMADFAQVYKFVVKQVALQHNVFASFMPKPIFGENGSGMHCHQSIFKGDKNLFADHSDKYGLSLIAKSFTAGILKYVPEFTLITNQWVNSYKRLVPGYEAPVYISWGRRNRSSMVRVPAHQVGKEKATRVELRSPDPGANPYLAFAVMLAAGMKGIEDKLQLGVPTEENIYEMTPEQKAHLCIDTLPNSLENAVREFEKSALMRETLGEHVFTKLIENKKFEWDQYRIHVSQHEVDKYLPML